MDEPTFKPKFVSEYSMGSLDFERYNKWLEWIERYSAEIMSTMNPTLDMIQHYFSGLNVLWKNWKAIVSSPTKISEINQKVKIALESKRIWENATKNNMPFAKKKINELVDVLDDIHTKLMDLKQIIGLGIVVKKNMSTQEKIRAGMSGLKNSGSLPEK